MQTFDDLVSHFLKDMFYAEQQLARFLPRVAAELQSPAAREAADTQLRLAKSHVETLKGVFKALDHEAQGVTCEAILGLIKETEELLAETGRVGPVRDAGLLACLLAIQHYAVARYAALLGWAKLAGNAAAQDALSDVLRDAQDGARRIEDLARGEIAKAAKAYS